MDKNLNMNKYTFEHCKPTLEYFLKEFKLKEKTRILRTSQSEDFCQWVNTFLKNNEIVDIWAPTAGLYDIAYVNINASPYKICNILMNAFNILSYDGIIICNHFFENRPLDEFDKNPRYGIDAFCFVAQNMIDILYKGNQIIIKKIKK